MIKISGRHLGVCELIELRMWMGGSVLDQRKNQPSRDLVHTAKQSLSRSIPLMLISIFSSMSKNRDTKKGQDKEFGTLTAVPDGFTTRSGPNDREFVVPQYLIPALDHAFASFRKKVDLGALKANPQVSLGARGTAIFAVPCRVVSRHPHLFILSPTHFFHDS
jgi:hypothetical protein